MIALRRSPRNHRLQLLDSRPGLARLNTNWYDGMAAVVRCAYWVRDLRGGRLPRRAWTRATARTLTAGVSSRDLKREQHEQRTERDGVGCGRVGDQHDQPSAGRVCPPGPDGWAHNASERPNRIASEGRFAVTPGRTDIGTNDGPMAVGAGRQHRTAGVTVGATICHPSVRLPRRLEARERCTLFAPADAGKTMAQIKCSHAAQSKGRPASRRRLAFHATRRQTRGRPRRRRARAARAAGRQVPAQQESKRRRGALLSCGGELWPHRA